MRSRTQADIRALRKLDAIVVTTGSDSYRRADGIGVVPILADVGELEQELLQYRRGISVSRVG